jgi:hypothetical protein
VEAMATVVGAHRRPRHRTRVLCVQLGDVVPLPEAAAAGLILCAVILFPKAGLGFGATLGEVALGQRHRRVT